MLGTSRPSAVTAAPCSGGSGSGSAVNSLDAATGWADRVAGTERAGLRCRTGGRVSTPFLPAIPDARRTCLPGSGFAGPAAGRGRRPSAALVALTQPRQGEGAGGPARPRRNRPPCTDQHCTDRQHCALIDTAPIGHPGHQRGSPLPTAAAVASTPRMPWPRHRRSPRPSPAPPTTPPTGCPGVPAESAAAFRRAHCPGAAQPFGGNATVLPLRPSRCSSTTTSHHGFPRTHSGPSTAPTAAGSVTVNGHTWVADPKTHLYTTTADLAQEWQTY